MLASASAMAQSKDDVRDTAAVDTAVWKSLELEGVVVKSHAVKVKVQGDSLVYNAAAYRVPEGSTLEALVKQLPGAKVDKDGTIKINGKEVSKILVDGKEFFLNDKEVAMKNIPTDMIDKLKTYERKSDRSRVTGIDDGEEETVLDLTVKKGMKNGWFGNVNQTLLHFGYKGTYFLRDKDTKIIESVNLVKSSVNWLGGCRQNRRTFAPGKQVAKLGGASA